jgi:hypothetical protein
VTAALPEPVAGDAGVTPGYCSDHPNQRLVTHRAARLRAYGVTVATICPSLDHDFLDRERCRWCGHELVGPTEPRSSVSPRRAYCTPLHRLQAFRAARKAARS